MRLSRVMVHRRVVFVPDGRWVFLVEASVHIAFEIHFRSLCAPMHDSYGRRLVSSIDILSVSSSVHCFDTSLCSVPSENVLPVLLRELGGPGFHHCWQQRLSLLLLVERLVRVGCEDFQVLEAVVYVLLCRFELLHVFLHLNELLLHLFDIRWGSLPAHGVDHFLKDVVGKLQLFFHLVSEIR